MSDSRVGRTDGKELLREAKATSKNRRGEPFNKNTQKEPIMKNNIETIKTIIITMLITGILAFIAGIYVQRAVSHDVSVQVKDVVSAIKVEPSKQ